MRKAWCVGVSCNYRSCIHGRWNHEYDENKYYASKKLAREALLHILWEHRNYIHEPHWRWSEAESEEYGYWSARVKLKCQAAVFEFGRSSGKSFCWDLRTDEDDDTLQCEVWIRYEAIPVPKIVRSLPVLPKTPKTPNWKLDQLR